jgi:hypothetical protein
MQKDAFLGVLTFLNYAAFAALKTHSKEPLLLFTLLRLNSQNSGMDSIMPTKNKSSFINTEKIKQKSKNYGQLAKNYMESRSRYENKKLI